MSDSSTVPNAARQFSRYISLPVFVLGLIGNSLNVIIFTRRSLIKNPCTVYLLSSTITNINVLFFGLLVRSLHDDFSIDIIGYSVVLCRLRYFILHTSYTLSSWFLVLASIDRYCLSSRHAYLRNYSCLSKARRSIALTSVGCLLIYIHILGFFQIENLSSGPYCYAEIGSYRVFYDFLFFALFSCLPPISMMIIGLATLRHVRLVRQRIRTTGAIVRSINRKDRQLIVMLFVQLIATILCTLPHAILKLYTTFSRNQSKTIDRLSMENLLSQITRQLLYINASMSFYL